MKLLFRFILDNISVLICYLISAVVYMVVFSLYYIETEAVVYATIVILFAIAVIFSVRFIRYVLRHKRISRLCDRIGCMIETLPEHPGSIEGKYIETVELMRDMISDAEANYKSSRTEMLDYFTTWVHQIKIPISVMRMELAGQDTNEARELSSELFRIEQYVEMVLCYFRLGDGSKDLVVRETELDPVIRANVRKYAPVFIRKRIRLVYDGTDEKAVTDSKWMDFIIGQLLSNALKYTKQGSVTILVTTGSITVSDTGIGIAPEDLPRIFERGYTGQNGRIENRSTGIGLYLVKKAADRIGAELSVRSTAGQGTSVTVTIPTEKIKE